MKTSPDGILEIMEYKLYLDFKGKGSAKNRFKLLEHCRIFFPELTDRTMRKIYSKYFCIGHSKDGIYLADDSVEIDKMMGIMEKKRETYREKILRFELQKEKLIRMKIKEAEQLPLFRRV